MCSWRGWPWRIHLSGERFQPTGADKACPRLVSRFLLGIQWTFDPLVNTGRMAEMHSCLQALAWHLYPSFYLTGLFSVVCCCAIWFPSGFSLPFTMFYNKRQDKEVWEVECMQEWQEVVNLSKLLSGMNSTNLTAWQVTFKLNPWLLLVPAQ